ncbi:hornerin [Panicum miliaceum]|uniref:Hornerin n=1 Tax=Panicum miliaceum TaxID=4540 RepID=A0A3L6SQA0_PANMI|nr:hornerin [Panicum miliaceum]
MKSSSHKRAREAADLAAAGDGALPEAGAKRLRPEDLLADDADAAAAGDLAAVMLEASDNELWLPPTGAFSSSSEAGAAGAPDVAAGLDGQIWGARDDAIPAGHAAPVPGVQRRWCGRRRRRGGSPAEGVRTTGRQDEDGR